MKRFSALIPVICLMLVSCEKILPARLELGQTSVSLESPAGGAQVKLTSTRSWTATANSPWFRVVPDSGNGGYDVPTDLTILCEENVGHTERTGTVTIRSDGKEQTITVTQGHKQGVLLDAEYYDISDQAQVFDIHLWTTEPVSVEVDSECSSWLTLVGTKAMSESTQTISATLNTSSERKGKVYVRHGKETETIVIRQAPSDIPISDPGYKSSLITGHDLDKDGCLSIDEALKVKELFIGYLPVTTADLSYFPNVESLQISGVPNPLDLSPLQKLKFLDISYGCKEINLTENHLLETVKIWNSLLKTLDLQGKDKLRTIELQNNGDLETLLLDDCRNLSKATLSINHALRSLDFQSCKSLKSLGVSNGRALESIYANGLPNLIKFGVSGCNNLTLVDLQNCPKLEEFGCSNSSIQTLKLNGDTGIKSIYCTGFVIESLDISSSTSLEVAQLYYSKIKSIRMGDKPVLNTMYLYSIELETIDLSGCSALVDLNISYNSLKSLNLSGLSQLVLLNCSHNQITSLDISPCMALESLSAEFNQLRSFKADGNREFMGTCLSDNNLTEIELIDCEKMTDISLSNNKLESLDFSGAPNLRRIYCDGNRLKSLDVKRCVSLSQLYCSNNVLTELDLTRSMDLSILDCTGNPDLRTVYLSSSAHFSSLEYDPTTEIIYK